MVPHDTPLTIPLSRYRGQYAHAWIVWMPMLVLVLLAILFAALHRLFPSVAVDDLGAAVGGAVALLAVLGAPRLLARWRAQGQAELRVQGDRLQLTDPVSGQILGECSASEGLAPAVYGYPVTGRTHQAPAVLLHLEGTPPVSIGVVGSPLVWSVPTASLRRPDYKMSADSFESLLTLLGQRDRVRDCRAPGHAG